MVAGDCQGIFEIWKIVNMQKMPGLFQLRKSSPYTPRQAFHRQCRNEQSDRLQCACTLWETWQRKDKSKWRSSHEEVHKLPDWSSSRHIQKGCALSWLCRRLDLRWHQGWGHHPLSQRSSWKTENHAKLIILATKQIYGGVYSQFLHLTWTPEQAR